MVPQPLGKKNSKEYANSTISKKFSTTPLFTKSLSTTLKTSPASAFDHLTTQHIINASLRKSACQKYLYYQPRWKEYCAENNITYDSPAVLQFTELFKQGLSDNALFSAKDALAHILRMTYQHIPKNPSVIKYFKEIFNLRPSLPKLSFDWIFEKSTGQ